MPRPSPRFGSETVTDLRSDLVVVNVSEGIGTGIFSNGRLLRGANGMAGEFGHVEMEHNGHVCGCGGRGCWETVASNSAGLRYYQEISGKRLSSFSALVKIAQAEDANAIKALEKMSRFLGRGLRMIASALAPSEIIIVGGYYERLAFVRSKDRSRAEAEHHLETAEITSFVRRQHGLAAKCGRACYESRSQLKQKGIPVFYVR